MKNGISKMLNNECNCKKEIEEAKCIIGKSAAIKTLSFLIIMLMAFWIYLIANFDINNIIPTIQNLNDSIKTLFIGIIIYLTIVISIASNIFTPTTKINLADKIFGNFIIISLYMLIFVMIIMMGINKHIETTKTINNLTSQIEQDLEQIEQDQEMIDNMAKEKQKVMDKLFSKEEELLHIKNELKKIIGN